MGSAFYRVSHVHPNPAPVLESRGDERR